MSKNLIGPESQVSCPVSDENQVKKKKKNYRVTEYLGDDIF